MTITLSRPHIDGLIPVESLEIRGLRSPAAKHCCLPCTQPLPERRCEVYTSLWRRIHSVSDKTDTSLNIYCIECASVFGVPYACVFLWTCNILAQLSTLQRCFCTSTLKPNRFVRYSCCIVCISLPPTLEA
jgi:hypothetical protein